MNLDTLDIINLTFSLLGAFAALLWLRPGKQQAIRYAVIMLSFAGLCAILYQNPGEFGFDLLHYLPHAILLFVFLLGRYMLGTPWRRAFLSLGVYALVAELGVLVRVALGEHIYPIPFGFYLTLAWVWFTIFLCTRKDSSIGRTERIFAAAATLIVANSLTEIIVPSLWGLLRVLFSNDLWELTPPEHLSLFILCMPVLILTLCYAANLRYVLRQAWVRTVCTTAIAVAVQFGAVNIYFYAEQLRESRKSELTEELIIAIEENDITKVQHCLSEGVKVNRPLVAPNDRDGELSYFFPLIHATARNQVATVKALLTAGANVHVCRVDGDTALLSACIENNAETIRLLLQAGSDVNATNNLGYTPLYQSTLTGNSPEIVSMLLQAGADTNLTDNEGSTALHNATLPDTEADKPASLAVMRLLLEHGAAVNTQDCHGDTPLLQCAECGFTEGARLLLEHGADPTLRNKNGNSPLELAEQNGHSEIAELLRAAR
ncbi:MAG: ankyrin repeat domain-containing protein [Akkermansia sp.]|nr:ankyrin repeat domain-containing protein [Akkermansia sp.]